MTRVPIPPIVRGSDRDSGSAQLVVLIVLQTPGAEALCNAPELRLAEMFDEVMMLVDATGVPAEVKVNGATRWITFENGSRIVFRTPRRDGTGVRGIHPTLIWLDQANRYAEVEAVEQVKRFPMPAVNIGEITNV